MVKFLLCSSKNVSFFVIISNISTNSKWILPKGFLEGFTYNEFQGFSLIAELLSVDSLLIDFHKFITREIRLTLSELWNEEDLALISDKSKLDPYFYLKL